MLGESRKRKAEQMQAAAAAAAASGKRISLMPVGAAARSQPDIPYPVALPAHATPPAPCLPSDQAFFARPTPVPAAAAASKPAAAAAGRKSLPAVRSGPMTTEELRARIRLQLCRAFDSAAAPDATDFANEIVETSAEIEGGESFLRVGQRVGRGQHGRQAHGPKPSRTHIALPFLRAALCLSAALQSCSTCTRTRERPTATNPGEQPQRTSVCFAAYASALALCQRTSLTFSSLVRSLLSAPLRAAAFPFCSCREVAMNLKDVGNPELKARVMSGSISVHDLLTLPFTELASTALKSEREAAKKWEMAERRSDVQPHVTVTDAWRCGKCRERKCSYYQMQTRSADEVGGGTAGRGGKEGRRRKKKCDSESAAPRAHRPSPSASSLSLTPLRSALSVCLCVCSR